jgi:alpha-tubulin suppressor-like RCC1 family protein
MNYLEELPKELLYIIISYNRLYDDLDNLFKYIKFNFLTELDIQKLGSQIFPHTSIESKEDYFLHGTDQELWVMNGKSKQININEIGPIVKMVCGRNFNIILNSKNELYSWGSAYGGRLGIGNINNIDINHMVIKPTKIQGNYGKITQISCGSEHTGFINDQGELYTFGYNASGQLGVGDYIDKYTPTKVTGDFGKVTKVSCGYFHTMFYI